MKAVAIGGGTGMPIVLRCLLGLGFDPTAIVTVADDGGSSGRLRRETGILPPGDVRNCLVALSDPDSPLARVFQYRFTRGKGLAGHTLGNLMIAALADMTGSFPEAIEVAGGLLGARGRVLPSTLADVRLYAVDRRGRRISGQAAAATSAAGIQRVLLRPEAPPAHAPALDALRGADLVVIGPGSLFTSIIPNFLVDGVSDALRASAARRVYVCNVANQRGETAGMDAGGHVRALLDHGLEGALDVVVVDPASHEEPEGFEPVDAGPEVRERIVALGLEVIAADVVDEADHLRHDAAKLSSALKEVA